jgi:hypothetical protein
VVVDGGTQKLRSMLTQKRALSERIATRNKNITRATEDGMSVTHRASSCALLSSLLLPETQPCSHSSLPCRESTAWRWVILTAHHRAPPLGCGETTTSQPQDPRAWILSLLMKRPFLQYLQSRGWTLSSAGLMQTRKTCLLHDRLRAFAQRAVHRASRTAPFASKGPRT